MWGSSIFQVLVSSVLLCTFLQEPTLAIKKSYIVYLGGHSHGPDPSPVDLESATNSHYDLLGSVLGSREKAKEAIIYSYNRNINGFAALLEEEEAAEIGKKPNVVSVFKSKEHKLHTTRSWEFLGLEKNGVLPGDSAWRKGRFGQDTIIANIDSGVWPEHESFNDRRIGPTPSKWRGNGICQISKLNGSKREPCNRKLIGARFFSQDYEIATGQKIQPEYRSARDFSGHGTHTLAIAGGNFVKGANVSGNGNGTAKGGSPRARVVAYKVCWHITEAGGCHEADILQAFEHAISDGVDVISVSIGTFRPYPEAMFTDGISVGAFHAVARGIVVVCSAGNEGPDPGTVANVAPWIFTVAASSIDREFVSNISLGNRRYLKGASLNTGLRLRKFYPVIQAIDAKLPNATVRNARLCKPGTLDPSKVRGKLLICLRSGKISSVGEGGQALLAGAAGMFVDNDRKGGNTLLAENHILPATSNPPCTQSPACSDNTANSGHSNLWAYFTKARTDLGTKPAPVMASFSSRGPSATQPLILKPDITAPGLNILSSYSNGTSPTNLPSDNRRISFNILSGTSQSCPHVSGIAGLLKTLHPNWSPAAIKSAIMTTATTQNKTNGPILDQFDQIATPLDYGSGHIRPNLAMDPGLVYDLNTADYLNFVCASGYTQDLKILYNHKPYTCPDPIPKIEDLNYPSITVQDLPIKVNRRVTNVGPPSTYTVNTHVRTRGLKIQVQPNSLTFTKTGETKTFQVIMQSTSVSRSADQYLFGELSWIDGKHTVRSPIVVLPPVIAN